MMGPNPPRLRQVYGRAFLIQLDRGDMELAKVFARAMLIAGNGNGNDQA